jgi:Fe-S-cluster-containing dehydrogenase component
MTKGLCRRDLLVRGGAVVGATVVGATVAGKTLGAVVGNATSRWGIAVDLGRCASRAGCRRCMDACHAAHRVPVLADPRHEVKWVWKEPFARVFPEQVSGYETEARRETPVLVLCNHCKNAPCTRVCPTGATWRRSDGVVAMDQHRCIGCRYCMAACPYGARSFNWEAPTNVAPGSYPTRATGVVEKCTFCVERVDVGLAPLCVETCRQAGSGALTFGNLDDAGSPIRQLLASRQVLRRRPGLGTEPSIFYLA